MKILLYTFGLSLFVFSFSSPAHACEPIPVYMQSSLSERVSSADAIFEGRVVKVLPNTDKGIGAEITVTRYFKSIGPELLTVYGFGFGDDCNVAVAPGDVRIFYVKGNPQAEPILKANRIKGLDQAEVVNNERVDEMLRILKHPPVVPQ